MVNDPSDSYIYLYLKPLSYDTTILLTISPPIEPFSLDVKFPLSGILEIITNIHILVLKAVMDSHGVTDVKVESIGASTDSIEVVAVTMPDRMNDIINEIEHSEKYENMTTNYYDFSIPEDSNIILGSCRDIDQTFSPYA